MKIARALLGLSLGILSACGGAAKPSETPAAPVVKPEVAPTPVVPETPQPTLPTVSTPAIPAPVVFVKSKEGMVVGTAIVNGDRTLWIGDEKTLYQQRVFGGGSDGTRGSWNVVMWAPRAQRAQASFDFDGKEYFGSCAQDQKIAFTPLPEADQARLRKDAKLEKPLWERQAVFLARNDRGVYYYVDGIRADHGKTGQRVFVGKTGEMKLQKMKNIVDDQAGMIFETDGGALRLVMDKTQATWIAGKSAPVKLVVLDVQSGDNPRLIYKTLGIYGKLGSLCDNE